MRSSNYVHATCDCFSFESIPANYTVWPTNSNTDAAKIYSSLWPKFNIFRYQLANAYVCFPMTFCFTYPSIFYSFFAPSASKDTISGFIYLISSADSTQKPSSINFEGIVNDFSFKFNSFGLFCSDLKVRCWFCKCFSSGLEDFCCFGRTDQRQFTYRLAIMRLS